MNNNIDTLLGNLGGGMPKDLEQVIQPPAEGPPFGGGAVPPFSTPSPAYPPFPSAGDPLLSRKEERQIVSDSARTVLPSTLKRFGALQRLVPGAVRVRIKKRLDNGQLANVRDYSFREIELDGDVEALIEKYLKPKYGGGEWPIYVIDEKGVDHFAGVVNLIAEPATPQQDNALVALLAQSQRDLQNALQRPQPSPIAQFREVKQVMEEFGGRNGDGGVGALAGVVQALIQQPRGSDPALAALMDRMDRRLERLENQQSAPVPMPPPPPPGPSMVEIMGAVTAFASGVVIPLMSQMRSEPMKPEVLIGLITSAQTSAAQAAAADKVTTRELLAIIQADKEKSVTLEDEMKRFGAMREFAASFLPQQPSGPAGTSFWDALVALFSSNDFAAALGGRIRESGNKALPAQTSESEPGQAEVVDLSAARARRDAAAAQVQPQQPRVALPPGFDAMCKAIQDAPDDGARVESTVKALFAVHGEQSEQWKPFVNTLLENAAKNEKENTLRGLGGWFKLLVENKMLTREAAIATLKSFDEHWELIRMDLLSRLPHLQKFAQTSAPQVPPGAPAPAPATQQPAPEAQPEAPAEPPPAPPQDIMIPDEVYAPQY
jgi:hypothetical protein